MSMPCSVAWTPTAALSRTSSATSPACSSALVGTTRSVPGVAADARPSTISAYPPGSRGGQRSRRHHAVDLVKATPGETIQQLADALTADPPRHVTAVEVAGPGFVNFRLDPAWLHELIGTVVDAGADYGRSDVGAGTRVMVEYVSANPTGPAHAGHARGAVYGDSLARLLRFVGDTLVTSQSVYIDNVLSADSNRVEFYDDSNTLRTNLYTAAGTMAFNAVLQGGGSSYRLMFTSPPGGGNDYGEAGAITVNDASSTPITGTISGSSIAFDYDYDGNTQGGYAGGTDRPVTLIGIRPGYGKFAVATGMLTRSKTIALSLVAETDRVYA